MSTAVFIDGNEVITAAVDRKYEEMLFDWPFVTVSSTWHDGLEAAFRLKPEVIFLDGATKDPEFYVTIFKRVCPESSLIVTFCHYDLNKRIAVIQAGADDYIDKIIVLETLSEIVEERLQSRLLQERRLVKLAANPLMMAG